MHIDLKTTLGIRSRREIDCHDDGFPPNQRREANMQMRCRLRNCFSAWRTLRHCVSFSVCLLVGVKNVDAVEADPPSAAHAAYFEQHVRPLLVKQCYECHSAESKILQGGLLLDSRPGWQKGGDSGPVIVPGKPEESLLVRAVQYAKDEFVHMPPKGKLSDAEIAVFVEWVRLGAPDPRTEAIKVATKREINIDEAKKYWAFQSPRPVEVPAVKDAAWCRTSVDRFIQAKLEAAGLKANPTADTRTLVRRAYFDLVGLPPTPEEVDAFVAAGPDAYDALLDQLLTSPHYGERWGRHWMDLARFGESHGFEQDYDRPNAYHYRDFVIEALNRDLPYDTFVKWQLAGDEYEPENPLALKATGFLAAGVHATQITANQAEKERYDELDDMARTVGTTMLGLTVGCARCHDHKFDPITNADYYRIVAAFTTTVRSDFDVNLDPAKHRAATAEFEKRHQPLVETLTAYERKTITPQFDAWLAKRDFPKPDADWIALVPSKATASDSVALTAGADGDVRTFGTQSLAVAYNLEAVTQLGEIGALRLEALADDGLPQGGPGTRADGGFELRNLKITASPAGKRENAEPIKVEVKIAKLTATHDRSRNNIAQGTTTKPESWAIDDQTGRDHSALFEFAKPVGFKSGTKLTIVAEFEREHQGLGRFRLAVRPSAKDAELDGTTITEPMRQALTAFATDHNKKLTAAERKALFAWYCTSDAEWRSLYKPVAVSESKRPRPTIAKVLISSEGVPAVRLHTQGPDFYDKTYVLRRGDPNQKVEEASPGYLQVLVRTKEGDAHWPAKPPEKSRTSYKRRALAEWMTDVELGAGNLLARVIVNRLWYYHFGRGIVSSPSDFGMQGEKPSHPELLDYLANELIRGGWRLKPIHKLIMTSSVYRQTATADAARRKADPENRLFWHRDLRRLEGEIIRDAMLAASGKLDETMFGPGTLDPKQLRRSIYFFIKRSKLVPIMTLFDGPDTLQDLAMRSETTVAPQALLMMNNEVVRGYAVDFARRIMPPSQVDAEEGVVAGYRIALGRKPAADELRDAAAFIHSQTETYASEGRGADAASSAWADFCQVLFGLNEFVYIE